MKRILVVNVNWLGDVLFSTAFIRAVKDSFPQSYLACLLVPRVREVLEGNPYVDEIILYDEKGKHQGLWGKKEMVSLLRKKRFDTVFLLHRSLTRALITALAGIPERIGYWRRKRGFLLTEKLIPPKEAMHKVEYFLGLLGDKKDRERQAERYVYEFFISDDDRRYIKEWLSCYGLRDREEFIAVNPGGNWELKRWPRRNFASLISRLKKEYGRKIVITGAKKDLSLAEEIASLSKVRPIIFAGRTNLKQLGALLERAKLVISNDSGPLHIASALGTKTIALFGPTSPQITGPYGRGKSIVIHKDIGCPLPCYNLRCKDNRCMKAITVADVLEKILPQRLRD